MRLAIRLDETPLVAKLKRLASKAALRSAFLEIAARMETATRMRFEAGTDPDGKKWKPSARALKEGGRTLVDTAHLMQSITSRSDDTAALVGSNVIYARIHQLGGKAGRGGSADMPARPYLGFSREDKTAITEIFINNLRAA